MLWVKRELLISFTVYLRERVCTSLMEGERRLDEGLGVSEKVFQWGIKGSRASVRMNFICVHKN